MPILAPFRLSIAGAFALYSSASAWTPARFGSNLAAWYDPSDASTVTQSGGLVSQLNDKSGNGYHLTATGTARPTYSATGMMSNIPGLYFNGTANVMSTGTTFNFGTTTVSLFTLSSLDESGSGSTPKFAGYAANGDAGDYSSHSCEFLKIKAAGSVLQTATAGAGRADSLTIPIVGATQPLYTGVVVRMGSVLDGTNSQVFIDNQASSQIAYTPAFTSPGKVSIGGRNDVTVLWKGWMGETIILKRAPTSDERLKLNSWLIRSWNRVLICEGDSIVHDGPGFGIPPGQTDDGHNGYCYRSVPNISPKAFLDDIAIGGSDMQTASNSGLLFRRAAYLDNRIPANKYGKQYIVFFSVINNVGVGADAATKAAYHATKVAQYAVDLKAAGADKVVTATITSRTDAQADDATRNIYNATISNAGWSGLTANGGAIDAVVPFAADSIMGVDAAPTVNPTYFADTVHPNSAGHARLEPIFTAAINSL